MKRENKASTVFRARSESAQWCFPNHILSAYSCTFPTVLVGRSARGSSLENDQSEAVVRDIQQGHLMAPSVVCSEFQCLLRRCEDVDQQM